MISKLGAAALALGADDNKTLKLGIEERLEDAGLQELGRAVVVGVTSKTKSHIHAGV